MDDLWQEISNGLNKIFSIDTTSSEHKQTPGPPILQIKSGIQSTKNHNNTNNKITKNEYIRLYTIIYNSCSYNSTSQQTLQQKLQPTHKTQIIPAEYIYNKLTKYITEYICNLSETTHFQTSETGLAKFNQLWTNYRLSTIIISNLFNYINRIWVKPEMEKKHGIHEIHRYTQITWITHMLDKYIVQINLIINGLINCEREGNIINTGTISNFIESLLILGDQTDEYMCKSGRLCIYYKYFESNFLANTIEYYTRLANDIISQRGITDYMLRVPELINNENHRINTYLHNISSGAINTILENVLIKNFEKEMVAELPRYLANDLKLETGILYDLMKRINGTESMADIFSEFILLTGQNAISGLKDITPQNFMDAVLGVYIKGHQILREYFKDDILFTKAMDKASQKFINTNTLSSKPGTLNNGVVANILARYTDSVLRVSNTTGRENDIETLLDNIIKILKYLDDKDIFQKFYSKFMAKRLITGRIISEDAENIMISKLKTLCGAEYTSKFQIMTRDLTASRDLAVKYKTSLQTPGDNTGPGVFDILVLTSGCWPIQSTPANEFILPIELQKLADPFTAFYLGNTQGRKLNWLHNMSYGDLTTNYIKGSDGKKMKYVFQASGIQMVILLAFNQSETLTHDDLVVATGLKPDILAAQMELLVKMKIVKHKTGGVPNQAGLIPNQAIYQLNSKYSYKKLKVNINQPIKTDTVAESAELVKSAEEDRKFAIQATIVRIMKSRNSLGHSLLVSETIQQCSKYFTPKVQAIKKNIDLLIEKEYLRRTKEKYDEYTYVA